MDLYNNPDNFQFAIVSDRTGGHRPSVFADAVEKLNLLKPEFVISIGDLIEGTRDADELNSQWDEFDGLVNKLQMPFFYVPGNHDIRNEIMAKKWRQRYGSSYYHFVYHDVLFICLNTDDPPLCSISEEQIEYFRKAIEANRDVRWTLVFMHRPSWIPDYSGETPKNNERFEALLADRNYTVFAGHVHRYHKFVQKGRRYYALSTTGGQGRGEEYITSEGTKSKKQLGLAKGEFDHVVWVTMTDDGPVLANLLLEGILDDEPSPQWEIKDKN